MTFFEESYEALIDNRLPYVPLIVFNKNFNIFNRDFKTVETIKHLQGITKQQIVREQTVIKDTETFYVARDSSSNMLYICFKDMMMLDIDHDPETAIKKVEEYCQNNPDYLFHVYSSRNGLHIFCVSHLKDYQNVETIKFMLDMGCDFYYTLYASVRGWCVRLNKKLDEFMLSLRTNKTAGISRTTVISEFKQTIGSGHPHPHLIELLKTYEKCLEDFTDAAPSKAI